MKRKGASSPTLQCCCDDIRACDQWNQDHVPLSGKTHRLWRNQHRTWTISSQELEGSVESDCPTCKLLMRAIMAFGWNFAHVKRVHLRLSRLVPQLRVSVEDFRPRDNWEFYLSHPYGMQWLTSHPLATLVLIQIAQGTKDTNRSGPEYFKRHSSPDQHFSASTLMNGSAQWKNGN